MESVPFVDVGIGLQWQRIKVKAHNLIGLGHHLGFGYPEGGLGYGAGEVVNLNSVELIDAYLNRVCKFTDDAVAIEDNPQRLILQPSE